MTLADNQGKPIIPLKFEKMDFAQQGELSMILAGKVYIDMWRGPGDIPQHKFEELIQAIRHYVDD